MTSQRVSLTLAALLALSTIACLAAPEEDVNNRSSNSDLNNFDPNNDDGNNDGNNDERQNEAGKDFRASQDQVSTAGAFEVRIQDGDEIIETTFNQLFNLSAFCQTFGEDDMDGFALTVALEDGVGAIQLATRSKTPDTWSYSWPDADLLDVPDGAAYASINFSISAEPNSISSYEGRGGEVTLTQLPFEADATDGFFHLKATSTINADVLNSSGQKMREATVTWTFDVPFDESLEECFAN